jgi:hypothetical protein
MDPPVNRLEKGDAAAFQRELALALCAVVFRQLQKIGLDNHGMPTGLPVRFPAGSVTVDMSKFQDWFNSHSAELNWLLMRNDTTLRSCFTYENFWSTLVAFTDSNTSNDGDNDSA